MTVQFPFFDAKAFADLQEKNFEALVKANKTAIEGYQSVAKRQADLIEKHMTDAKEKFGGMKPEAVTFEAATANAEEFKAAVEKATVDAKDLFDAVQKTNEEVFDILKTRAEEAMVEAKSLMAA
ncbi:MAG: TIGR01841 family phasin [Pseudomonadota bacterium]